MTQVPEANTKTAFAVLNEARSQHRTRCHEVPAELRRDLDPKADPDKRKRAQAHVVAIQNLFTWIESETTIGASVSAHPDWDFSGEAETVLARTRDRMKLTSPRITRVSPERYQLNWVLDPEPAGTDETT